MIHVTMVEGSHHAFLENTFELIKMNHHARLWARLSLEGHFQQIVVAVTVGVRARTKDLSVFRFRPVFSIQTVGRGELDSAGYI